MMSSTGCVWADGDAGDPALLRFQRGWGHSSMKFLRAHRAVCSSPSGLFFQSPSLVTCSLWSLFQGREELISHSMALWSCSPWVALTGLCPVWLNPELLWLLSLLGQSQLMAGFLLAVDVRFPSRTSWFPSLQCLNCGQDKPPVLQISPWCP